MKYASLLLLPILIILNACSQIGAQSVEQEIKAVENNLLQAVKVKGETIKPFNLLDRMKHYNVPGISIAMVKEGKLHWTKSYGLADTEKGTTINENTLFQAASITKPINALALLKLAEEGKIDLDVNVNQYLKNWQIEENEFTEIEKVTIRRLLNHSAGLNGHGFDGYQQTEGFPSIITILNGEGNSRRVAVENIPGTEWRYSGGGYVILQKVVEDVSGLPFEVYMENEILKPLGMTNSTYQQPLDTKLYTNVSAGHTGQGTVVNGKWNNYPERGPGGLWSTPSDFAKYCIAIQDIIAGKKEGFLSKKTIEMMLTKSHHDWGLGPWVQGEKESLTFSHDGRNEGFITDFLAFVNKGDAVIVMTNGNNGGALIGEYLKAVSAYYKWNTHEQRMIESPKMSVEKLNQFAGTYDWLERPGYLVEVVVRDGKLHLVAPGFSTLTLTPFNAFDFVELETGTEVKFHTSDDLKIKGLLWRGSWEFRKVN